MKQLNPYLIFSGNCKEAMTFYQTCLGGEIALMQTFGESPIEVPPEHQHRIFNTIFKSERILIMASDDLPTHPVNKGSNFALFVNFSDQTEQQDVFAKLSEGGTVLMPLEGNFGMLSDKFGIQWMFAHE